MEHFANRIFDPELPSYRPGQKGSTAMAGAAHVLSQLDLNGFKSLQRLLEDLRIHYDDSPRRDSLGPQYRQAFSISQHLGLIDFIRDNSMEIDQRAFAASRKAFADANRSVHTLLADLDNLQWAVWFDFISDKLMSRFNSNRDCTFKTLIRYYKEAKEE